jgi:ATP-binding cassette subfamily B protein
MTADTAQIEQVVGTTISVALRNALMAVGGLGYLLYLAPALTGMLVLIVPLVLVPIVWFGRRLRTVSRDSQDRVAGVGSLVSEVLGAMKIVQGFNQEGREFGRFADAVEATFARPRRILIRAVMTAIVIAFIFGAITALLWRGAIQVAEGTLSGGTIAAFVLTGVMVAARSAR